MFCSSCSSHHSLMRYMILTLRIIGCYGCYSSCYEAPHERPHQSFNVSEWTDSTGPRQTQKPSEPKGLHAGMIMASPGVLEPERVPCKSSLGIDFQVTNLDRKPNGFNGRGDLFFQVQSAPPLPPGWSAGFDLQ